MNEDRTVESVPLFAVTQGQQVQGTRIRVSWSPQKPPGSWHASTFYQWDNDPEKSKIHGGGDNNPATSQLCRDGSYLRSVPSKPWLCVCENSHRTEEFFKARSTTPAAHLSKDTCSLTSGNAGSGWKTEKAIHFPISLGKVTLKPTSQKEQTCVNKRPNCLPLPLISAVYPMSNSGIPQSPQYSFLNLPGSEMNSWLATRLINWRLELEQWFSGQGCLLLSQKTPTGFPEPTWTGV